jgi:hypothetical protein
MRFSKMRISSFCLFLALLIVMPIPPLENIAHAEVPETAATVLPQTGSTEPNKTSDNKADEAPLSAGLDQELAADETAHIPGWYLAILILSIITALGTVGI